MHFKKRTWFAVFVICCNFGGSIGWTEESAKLSLIDFEIQSDNPQFKYLGKGFAEFVSIELSKSRKFTLVEREKREDVFKEQAFSISGAVEGKNAIEVGKMLAASHIITGKIFELAGKLTVTFKVIDTTSGKILYEDKVTNELEKYDNISAAIAKSIMEYFKTDIPKETAKKIETPLPKPMDAAIKFSSAVDAYDKKEFEKAREELKEAKKLFPESDAVNLFLEKLQINTSKFRVELFKHLSYQNPAYLGLIKEDKVFLIGILTPVRNQIDYQEDYYIREEKSGARPGYNLRIKEGFGLGIEGIYSYEQNFNEEKEPNSPFYEPFTHHPRSIGVCLSMGYALSKNFTIGVGFSLYRQSIARKSVTDKDTYMAEELGILTKKSDNSVIFDSRFSYTNEKIAEVTIAEGSNMPTIIGENFLPVLWENTLTMAFKNSKTFFVVKQIDYFYKNDSFIADLIPAFEKWFSDRISGRFGLDLKYMKLKGTVYGGIGGILGGTYRKKNFDFDLNAEYRVRPSYLVPAEKFDEWLMYFSLSWKNVFKKN